MTQGKYVELSVAQRTDVWRRWKAGESLHTIGRAFDRPHTSIHCLLAHHGGIVPALRRRGLLALTLTEREEISRGMASGSSIRDIAKGLERAASTVSWEVARHGGRPEYRAHEADQRAWDSALRPKRCLLAIPKRTDLSGYRQSELDKIPLRLNQRPRKTLGFQTPASKLRASVAPTP
jgi:IS30 family transposase